MDQSYTDSDISLSPSRILGRLQVLRQVQLLQRGKLQKQLVQHENISETTSNITEIVSHFSNSTSYNTFRSLLQSSRETSVETTPRQNNGIENHVCEQDMLDGVSVLNISKESEFIISSPISTRSRETIRSETSRSKSSNRSSDSKKHISLDEMPILSPRKDFEDLILEKLQKEKNKQNAQKEKETNKSKPTRPFLRKGEGMSRFGLRKENLVIQNTKSLPWKRKPMTGRTPIKMQITTKQPVSTKQDKISVDILEPPSDKHKIKTNINLQRTSQSQNDRKDRNNDKPVEVKQSKEISCHPKIDTDCKDQPQVNPSCDVNADNKLININNRKQMKRKHPLIASKEKTWANVLTQEQGDFLRQLKQSDYYKNFNSPTKSIVSDVSCDETLHKLKQEREKAEQNMFEFLESKVSNESFHLENSFFNKFLKRSQLECSGESTPVVMQKCIQNNPDLLHIFPELRSKSRTDSSCEVENTDCCSEYTDCSSRNCSSPSTCCSCKHEETLDETEENTPKQNRNKSKKVATKTRDNKKANSQEINQSHNDTVTSKEMKANMEEMNAKLAATSDLLKERLRELEDEIETFRKENSHLVKMREDFDIEKQKFYEEKTAFEQKFNEDKILSEYHLAEEKEKLTKQKQLYERYVREMRGRLNKKEKDEVTNLKKEISDLKEEIRIKDAKSTALIARLRNQHKIMENDKKRLENEVEKLKKENRRIQHSNDVTRRLTNMKYLAEINKKLTQMTSKENLADVILDQDVKYKALEIERQNRKRNVLPVDKKTVRPRAKSVPNLNVTSRYAKYFSQRDVISHLEQNDTLKSDLGTYTCPSDDEGTDNLIPNHNASLDDAESITNHDSEQESNELEKIYTERFQSNSPSNIMFPNSTSVRHKASAIGDGFFINKSKSISKSPTQPKSNRSSTSSNPKTSLENDMYRSSKKCDSYRSKSPVSILSNPSVHTLKSNYGSPADATDRISVSPEPAQKTSFTKTSLNPTEIKKPDGSRELRFPNGNVKHLSADGKYCKFVYYNGDTKENFYSDGRIKYYYAETRTVHTTHPDGLEVLEFADGQVEKRYKDGSSEIRLANGSIRYFDPKNDHVREEWRFPDGTTLTVASNGEQRIVFPNGQVEVHAKDHKRREFPDGTVKLVYVDGTAETRYASGRIRIKDKHGNLLMDSATR